ncbi:MAG: hypothetical protein AB1714_12510 [Acidobacteriota bacterium]
MSIASTGIARIDGRSLTDRRSGSNTYACDEQLPLKPKKRGLLHTVDRFERAAALTVYDLVRASAPATAA